MTRYEKLVYLKSWFNDNKAGFENESGIVAAIYANPEIEAIIRELYLAVYTKTLGGCKRCVADALMLLYKFPDNKMQEIMNCKFKLRAGVLLMDSHGVLPNVTSANITDELAIAYLRDNRARVSMFESVPDNIDELLGEQPAESSETEAETASATTKKRKSTKTK